MMAGSSYENYKKLNKKIIKLNKKFNFDVKVSQNKKTWVVSKINI